MRDTTRWILGLLAVLLVTGPAAAKTVTYRELVGWLTDLDRLTHLQPDIRSELASSWDRGDLKRWGCNGDAGQYLRVEPNGEAVMLDVDGPGCVFRIWSANPQGKVRFYFDGATTPSYEWDFNSLFSGTVPPFIKPLVYQMRGQQSASDIYLPIPFAKHLKVTADQRHGQYYHLNYLRFPADWEVPSFKLPLTAAEEAAVQAAADAWGRPGTDPKPRLDGQQTSTKTIHLEPGETATVAELTGPAMIRGLRCKVTCAQRSPQRKIVLRGTWDGAAWPQLLSPLGPFFGYDWETPNYGSLVAGCRDQQNWLYWPMPFRRSGRLELVSFLAQPADVAFEVDWAPATLAADSLYFYARWRHEPKSKTFDYPFIETAGHGHLVGATLQIDHPIPGWWGEGDEKVWVDDDQFPPWIGTGSEDYFGDAWGLHYLPGPSFGAASVSGRRTNAYRWHIVDFIPFAARARMTIENYGPNGTPGPSEYEYNSVAYWYQQELTPPFEQLTGKTYLGAVKVGDPPSPQPYRTDLFPDLTAADLRTTGLDVPYALEAERLLAGHGHVIDDAALPYEFSGQQAVDFGEVTAGQVLAEFPLSLAKGGVMVPKLYCAPGAAALTLVVDGQQLAGPAAPAAVLALDPVVLATGDHRAQLVAVTAGHAVLDCLQVAPVSWEANALEAEQLPVIGTTGGGPAPAAGRPDTTMSAGQTLRWQPTAIGQGFSLELPGDRRGDYLLTVRAVTGPDGGIVQTFAAGQPLGPEFDLWAPQRRRADVLYSLGALPHNARGVELRVVGRHPQSTGLTVELDYFRFEPKILSPDTSPGIWARVLQCERCQYGIQDLGAAWSGNHQLWVRPSQRGAALDLAVEVPTTGEYAVALRLTTSWDYATVQPLLDGTPLGDAIDCFTTEVRQTPRLELGRVKLTAGRHVVRLLAQDKRADSKGYLMGLDYLSLKRVD